MDLVARNKLVEENKNLVYSTIYKLNLKINDDLIQEGFVALINAANKYTEEKGKFSTYAVSCIAGSLKTFINQKDRLIRPRKYKFKFEQFPVISFDDMVVDCAYTLDESEDLIYVNEFIKYLDDIEKEVLTYRLQGKSKQVIRQILNISNMLINKIFLSIQNKWYKYTLR